MNPIMNPIQTITSIFSTKNPAADAVKVVRETADQGPYTPIFKGWVPRDNNPFLYESLREGIPVLDGIVDRMCALDGILGLEGENIGLIHEIEDWMNDIKVNDLQVGLQSFFAGMSNELYEQGFAIGEPVLARGYKDVIRLNTLDSKGVLFFRGDNGALQTWYRPLQQRQTRGDGTQIIEDIIRGSVPRGLNSAQLLKSGFRRIPDRKVIYAGLNNEANNPYGVSIFRPLPFVSKVLLTIQNSTMNVWQRFGDPSFNLVYKTGKSLTDTDLQKRQQTLAKNLASTIEAKRSGKSVDFVNAISAKDEIKIDVIGSGGEVIDIEEPTKALLEQIVAKTGIPPWMLGFVWGTAERLATKQAEMMLQESRTRFALRRPALVNIISTMLRARGKTWNRGDWDLVQKLPNIADIYTQAQAEFLQAQTELMLSNANGGETIVSTEADGKSLKTVVTKRPDKMTSHAIKTKTAKGEDWAIDDEQLIAQADATTASIQDDWQKLADDLLQLLKLPSAAEVAKASDNLFVFTADTLLGDIEALAENFIQSIGGEDSALAKMLVDSWISGRLNGGREIDVEFQINQLLDDEYNQVISDGLDQVRSTFKRTFRDSIIKDLSDGVYDGQDTRIVAEQLLNKFGGALYDWERLVNSELSQSNALAKLAQYGDMDVEQYDYLTAKDSKVSAICRKHAKDGPYTIGSGPIPMRDSHPSCRCSVAARL